MADARSIATPTVSNKDHSPWAVLAVLSAAVFMLLLDTTIVNVAQVKIRQDLGASLTQIQWVLDSYILTYAVLLLSFGRLGDVLGRRRMFVFGMALFTTASALCGASGWIGDQIGVSGVAVLIGARVLQGLGGAFMMPQTLSLITVAFPPEKRGAALGIWGGIVALGAIIGPVIGGLIVTDYAWEWIFLLNVPIGIAGVIATRRIVPESVDPQASRRIDWGSILLSGTGIFALVYASIEGNKEGWTSPFILGLYAAAAVLLTAFVFWERRSPDPMMKLELFKLRNFWVGNVIALTVAFGMLGIFFPMTLFLQAALDFSPIRAGLTMTPMSVMIMIAAPLSGRFSDKIGARWILVGGLSLMTAGILLIVQQIDMNTDWVGLLPALVVTGLGMGMTFAPMTAAAMKEVPPRIAGSASGIINTMRNVGQVLGIAVLGGVLQSRVGAHAGDRLANDGLDPSLQSRVVDLAEQSRFHEIAALLPANLVDSVVNQMRLAFADGIQNTFFVGAMACLASALFALLIRNPARATAPAREQVEASERQVVMAAD